MGIGEERKNEERVRTVRVKWRLYVASRVGRSKTTVKKRRRTRVVSSLAYDEPQPGDVYMDRVWNFKISIELKSYMPLNCRKYCLVIERF